MTEEAPRRRGRPPAERGPGANPAPAVSAGPSAAEPAKRRRRAPVGGLRLKLDAPARPGFVRRWFNDEGNRIAEAGELAYDHVTQDGVQTSAVDSRISRLVGTKANGEPLRAFLMETPVEEYAAGQADKEATARQVDEAIEAGRDSTGQMSSIPQSEVYGQGSITRDR